MRVAYNTGEFPPTRAYLLQGIAMTQDFQQFHAALAAHDDKSINPSGNPGLDQFCSAR